MRPKEKGVAPVDTILGGDSILGSNSNLGSDTISEHDTVADPSQKQALFGLVFGKNLHVFFKFRVAFSSLPRMLRNLEKSLGVTLKRI